MNSATDTTVADTAPATRPLALQLLDIADVINTAADFAEALDMATMALSDTRQRNAMASVCDVLMHKMDDLRGMIECAREEVA